MSLPDDDTNSIRLSQSSELVTRDFPKGHRSTKTRKSRHRQIRPYLICYSIVIICCLGWGLSNYLGHFWAHDETDSLADIDGFESAEPFLGPAVSKIESTSVSSKQEMLISAPNFEELAPPAKPEAIEISTINPVEATEVWLTGTIEETEAAEKIDLPARMSGGPSDFSSIR